MSSSDLSGGVAGQSGHLERPLLRAEVLPPHDEPVAELEDAGARHLHLHAAPHSADEDDAEPEHPVAEVAQLVAGLELLIVSPGVGPKALPARVPPERALGAGAKRKHLRLRVQA